MGVAWLVWVRVTVVYGSMLQFGLTRVVLGSDRYCVDIRVARKRKCRRLQAPLPPLLLRLLPRRSQVLLICAGPLLLLLVFQEGGMVVRLRARVRLSARSQGML